MNMDLIHYYQHYYQLNCSFKSNNYIESQNFLKISSIFLFLVSTPINTFGIYCIIFKSPVELLTIKWCMLYLHSLATFSTIWFTLVAMPFIFFPMCAGFTSGIFPYWISLPIEVQGYIAVGSLGMLALSFPILFENRHRHLVDQFKITRPITRILFYHFNVLFVPCSLFELFLSVPPQASSRLQLLKTTLPCPTKDYFHEPVFVLSLNHLPITFYLSALSLVTFSQIMFFGGHSLLYLAKRSHKVSQSTRRLQRRFFMVISIQLTLPCVTLFIPVAYFIFSMFTGYYNQALNNFGVVVMMFYSAVATVTMVILHEPYLKILKNRKCYSKKPSKIFERRNAIAF